MLGAEGKGPLAEDAYPANPKGSLNELPPGRNVVFVDFASRSPQQTVTPFGPFKHAIDFYGDGSLYLVDTPGHFPGHICAVARVAPDAFVFLGGDICHDRQCYAPGTRLVSNVNHRDLATSRQTIQRLATLDREFENVVVILAHEPERLVEGLPLFPSEVREWAVKQIERRRAEKKAGVSVPMEQ